jgi:RNA polymerase sigma-70 factor, ECF subfamily
VGWVGVDNRSAEHRSNEGATELEALYDATLAHLYGFILLRVGGHVTIAEDLTQETYLALAQHLQNGQMPPAPLPWLYRVARNKVVDFYRRQERTAARITGWSAEAEAQPIASPGIDRLPDRELVRTALAHTPPAQRIALVLHYLDGLTVSEIAAELDRSEHAVESLLARGRANLRAHLIENEAIA